MSVQLTKNQYKIMGYLMKQPQSGYDIKKLLTKISKLYGSETNSQIYPSLNKLEKFGLVQVEIDPGTGNRPKKIYSITEAGQQALFSWLNSLEEPESYRNGILMKFSLAEYMDSEVLKKQLSLYKKTTEQRIAEVSELHSSMLKQKDQRSDGEYILMTLQHYLDVYKAQLKWAKEALCAAR